MALLEQRGGIGVTQGLGQKWRFESEPLQHQVQFISIPPEPATPVLHDPGH